MRSANDRRGFLFEENIKKEKDDEIVVCNDVETMYCCIMYMKEKERGGKFAL
jgi:hypothetical protein